MDRGQSGSSGKRGSGSCEWDLPRPLVIGRGRGKGSKVVSDKWASHLSWIWVVRELGERGKGGEGMRMRELKEIVGGRMRLQMGTLYTTGAIARLHDEVGRWHSLRFCGTSIVTFPNGEGVYRQTGCLQKAKRISNRARKNGRYRPKGRNNRNKGRKGATSYATVQQAHKGGRGTSLL